MKTNHPKSTGIPAFIRYAILFTNRRNSGLPFRRKWLVLVILILSTSPVTAEIKTASVSGNWSSASTWGGVSIPVTGDDVIINSGITVYVDIANISCNSLEIKSGAIESESGVLDLHGYSLSFGSLNGAGNIVNSGADCVLTTGESNTDAIFSGSISGAVGLTKNGSAQLTLSGWNSYTGTTILGSGKLNINHPSAIGTGRLIINGGIIDNTSGSAVQLLTNNLIEWNGDFSFGGSNDLSFGTGLVTIKWDRIVTLNGSGKCLLFSGKLFNDRGGSSILTIDGTGNTLNMGGLIISNSGTSRKITFKGTADVVMSGEISNGGTSTSGSLAYSGTGILTLNESSSYSGTTDVISGTIAIGNDGAFGTSKVNLGGTNAQYPAIRASGGERTIINDITLLATSDGGNPTIDGNDNFVLQGSLSVSGNRTLTIANTGKTTLAGNIILPESSTTQRTLTINGIGFITISGKILNFDSTNHTSNLMYSGSGKLTITGEIAYTGNTTLTSGELCLNPAVDETINSLFVLSGGKLSTTDISPAINIVNSKSLKLNGNAIIEPGTHPHSLKFADSHSITWTGNLIIDGWTGIGGRIFFGSSTGALTSSQLSKVSFTGFTGTPLLLATGELVPSNGTWLGLSDTDWGNEANWGNNQIPSKTMDVRVPSGLSNYPLISPTTTADCKNLRISAGAALTIESDESNSGSLMMAGSFSGAGMVTYNRYLSDRWHLIASPVATGNDQSVADFLSNTANNIYQPSNPSANQYEMVIYREEADEWNYYENELNAGGYFNTFPNFQPGIGYGLLRSSSGKVSFEGSLSGGDVSVSLQKSGNGWNLIGNPFTCAIRANDASGDLTNNFLQANVNNLEPNYAAVYIWEEGSNYDGETNYFRVITNGINPVETPGAVDPAQNYIQAGQGFIVKAHSDGSSVLFSKAMQTHSKITPLKSAIFSNWYGLQLSVAAGGIKAHTVISFNENMTKGLDVSYDAGLLDSGNGLEVYTRLVEDNGIDFAVQSLPATGLQDIPISLGVDCEAGGEITFTADKINLPASVSIILEDRISNSFTNLNTSNYAVIVPPNTKGTGRFYIYAGSKNATSITHKSHQMPDILVWSANSLINIQGQLSGQAVARLFDIHGRLLCEKYLKDKQMNQLSSAKMAAGIYLLQIVDDGWKTTKKVTIN